MITHTVANCAIINIISDQSPFYTLQCAEELNSSLGFITDIVLLSVLSPPFLRV